MASPIGKENFTDEQLIVQYLAGNEQAFPALIKRYLSFVYGLSREYCGDPDKAADIAQEVFIKVWRNIKKFNPAKDFRPWLFVIAKNTAADWLKKKGEYPFSSLGTDEGENLLENIADSRPSPSAAADDKILTKKVNNYLAELSVQHRLVITKHIDEDLTFREISKALKKPINTVKSHYRRALQILKENLQKSGN